MSAELALVIGLLLGLLLGAVGAVMLQRRSGADAADDLLRLAEERAARDDARREAADGQRDARLDRTLAPITQSLHQLERALARTEAARSQAEGSLRQQVSDLAERAQHLHEGTHALTRALRAPTARGRWGEVQLRRVVEAAGMLHHVDFTEQTTGASASGDAGQRPDMLIRLPGDRVIVLDAKAPMDAYLDAMDEPDPARAAKRRAAHATALRGHVGRLGKKAYWAALGDTPEMTVLFVPSDGVLAAALDADPDLLEDSFRQDVAIASPATLMALLRTVAHTWRTEALNRDARAVLDAGRELHRRLGTFAGHLGKVGRSLDASVGAFNDAVGSLESRVMVTARSFESMELTASRLPEIEQLTRRARSLSDDEVADLARGGRSSASSDGRRTA